MKKLRKLEEKLVFQDIQTQIHKKKTKQENDKIDRELREQAISEKASSEDKTPSLGRAASKLG